MLAIDFCLFFFTAKPCPPENVRIRKNAGPHAYFQYDIKWEMPQCEWNYSVTNYTVQALMLRDSQEANFCSCSTTLPPEVTMYPFMAGCSGINLDHPLYYRVAANTESAGQSGFTHGIHIFSEVGMYVYDRSTIMQFRRYYTLEGLSKVTHNVIFP